MMHYINIDKKRLCGRNNQTVPPILFDAATEEPLQLQFITSNNQIVHLDPAELSGLYFAGNTKPSEPSYDLLFLSKDYTIENDILTFNYSTYTKNFLRKITKRNQEILIEIGQIALEKKTLLLRDYALANPRVYIEGSTPEDVDWSDFYTKEETQELLAQNLSSAQAYADGQDASTLASATAYTDEKIAEIDLSEYATDADLDAAKTELDGKIALKASQADLTAVEAKADTNSGNIQTLSDDLDTHEADTTIHVTAADKTAWNAKAEVSDIPTDNAQLTNGAGYQTAQDVQNAISGKAETSYVDTELAKKQDKITSSNKLDYALLSGVPEDNQALVPIEVKTATSDCVYEVDFTGKAIQKYDAASATGSSSSIEVTFANLSNIPNGVAPTIELQTPVTEADVDTITLPVGTQVVDMPDTLAYTSGKIAYHDIVFRAEKDVNDDIIVYCNYAYKFEEEEAV